MSFESKLAEFSAFCVMQIDANNPSDAEYVVTNEIQPIKVAYLRIFERNPTSATIVRIVGRNLLREIEPGVFMHAACATTPDWPQYLLNTIAHCGVETRMIQGKDVPQWNGPPDMQVRVCILTE